MVKERLLPNFFILTMLAIVLRTVVRLPKTPSAHAFVVAPPLYQWTSRENRFSSTQRFSSGMASDLGLPTIDQLSSDPFMKQVSHSASLVSYLEQLGKTDENTETSGVVQERLQAQLSHSDGIRGFFVTYLTSGTVDEEQEADFAVPAMLVDAMNEVVSKDESAAEDLVSLCCMNVVMPSGMISMHQDPKLSRESQATARRGKAVLKAFLQSTRGSLANQMIEDNCKAILAVASGAADGPPADAKLVKYWSDFSDKWGYQEPQKKEIATAISDVLN